MSKITPVLWFPGQLEEAITYYSSIFQSSSTVDLLRDPEGKVSFATFILQGQQFMGLNGPDMFPFTEAVSFFVNCVDQKEVDYYWDRLVEGGKTQECGWLKDKYGLSWQIIPEVLLKYLKDPDAEKRKRVHEAMMKMVKIDVEGLEVAYKG